MNRMQLCIISGAKVLYEGPADAVFLPGTEGICELLPGHAPYMTLIRGGDVRVCCGKEERMFAVEGGVAWNCNNAVSILIFGDNVIK